MASYLLDTNIIVAFLRGHEDTVALWSTLLAEGDISISAITYVEVIAGIRGREEKLTYNTLTALTTFPLDVTIADQAGRLMSRYRARGITLEIADAAVAATAITHGMTLVTYNHRHFPMPELTIYPI